MVLETSSKTDTSNTGPRARLRGSHTAPPLFLINQLATQSESFTDHNRKKKLRLLELTLSFSKHLSVKCLVFLPWCDSLVRCRSFVPLSLLNLSVVIVVWEFVGKAILFFFIPEPARSAVRGY